MTEYDPGNPDITEARVWIRFCPGDPSSLNPYVIAWPWGNGACGGMHDRSDLAIHAFHSSTALFQTGKGSASILSSILFRKSACLAVTEETERQCIETALCMSAKDKGPTGVHSYSKLPSLGSSSVGVWTCRMSPPQQKWRLSWWWLWDKNSLQSRLQPHLFRVKWQNQNH